MRFPFFASFIIFMFVFLINRKKADYKDSSIKQNYLEIERQANSTRKKSLENLDYIIIPFSTLPMDTASQDEVVSGCVKEIRELSEEKIVNFTGYTNTDLKLKYGTANITLLSVYDQNFTLLVRSLQDWAKRLFELGHTDECLNLLEFAVSIRSDISSTYYLAAKIYAKQGNMEKIAYLIQTAQNLNSAMKNPIVRTLQESYPDTDSLHS